MSRPLVSIVIPAHNEEHDVGRTLATLLADTGEAEFDVIVVPNACTDRTSEIARAFPAVRVLDTPRPGKAGALQLGYEACFVYPRLFLDADVRLSANSVRELVRVLENEDGVLACSPRVEWDIDECGPAARRAHFAYEALMDQHRVLAGVGAYMLGEAGCARVFPMPDVIADDQYVHRSFDDCERRAVPSAVSRTRPASSFRSVVRGRARARAGNEQLDRLAPDTAVRQLFGVADLFRAVRCRKMRIADAGCFLAVVLTDRALAAWWRLRRVRAVWSVERPSNRRMGVR